MNRDSGFTRLLVFHSSFIVHPSSFLTGGSRMNRNRVGRWARRAVWGTLAVVMTVGCNPLTTIAFLTHRDTKVPAESPLTFKEGPKKNKDEIVVALFVSQGTGQSYDFAGAQDSLATELAKILPEMAKENKQKLVVVAPAQVNKFKIKNPNWKYMHPNEWGKQLGADFVLNIHLDNMNLFQPGSQNSFYEGRADATVDTYDVDQDPDEGPKHTYVHGFAYPKTGFRDASSKPVSAFRREFLENLAVELSRKHVDHKPSSGIAER